MGTAVEEKRKDQPQVPSILQQGTGQLAPAWDAQQVMDAHGRKDEGSSGWSKGQASLVVSNPVHGSSWNLMIFKVTSHLSFSMTP